MTVSTAKEYPERHGHDGVNNEGEEHIALELRQIKRVENRNSTENPDIRRAPPLT